ncbi:hypothetical protein EV121DRAFT_294640 [Schizophyllum commune]
MARRRGNSALRPDFDGKVDALVDFLILLILLHVHIRVPFVVLGTDTTVLATYSMDVLESEYGGEIYRPLRDGERPIWKGWWQQRDESLPLPMQIMQSMSNGDLLEKLRRGEHTRDPRRTTKVQVHRDHNRKHALAARNAAVAATTPETRAHYLERAKGLFLRSCLYNALLAPVLRLPVELLGEIFEHAVGAEEKNRDGDALMWVRAAIASVCSRWRDTAMAMSALWATTVFTRGFRKPECRANIIASHSRLARHRPVYIEVQRSSREQETFGQWWKLKKRIEESAGRLYMDLTEARCREGINLQMQNANWVELHGVGWRPAKPHVINGRKLEILGLTYLGGVESFKAPWHQLTVLNVKEQVVDAAYTVPVLALCQRLVALTIHFKDRSVVPLPLEVVTLPQLRKLDFGENAAILLACLSAPNLQDLRLTLSDPEVVTAAMDFVVTREHGWGLLEFYAESCEQLNPRCFRKLLAAMPNLLCIDIEGLAASKHRRRNRRVMRACLLRELVWEEGRHLLPRLQSIGLKSVGLTSLALQWGEEAEEALWAIIDSRCGALGEKGPAVLEDVFVETPLTLCSTFMFEEGESYVLQKGVGVACWEPGL